ncbi:MAG: preprotein translocase subunit Sec61beta [Candidatus Heimdallarchaeota archaeon]
MDKLIYKIFIHQETENKEGVIYAKIIFKLKMSLRKPKSKKDNAPMPSTGAGLMRYFDEDLPGFKISPRGVTVLTTSLIIIVLLLNSKINPFA